MSDRQAPRIVVVDDNPATRYTTARVLKAAGFVVAEAATGEEGIESAMQGADAVVLDVNLPDINGFEVCKRLRKPQHRADPGDPPLGDVCEGRG